MNESDLLKFMVVADTTQFQGKIEVATKELSSFEKAWGSVTKKITENKDVLVTTSSCITALSTAFKACHLAINNYIIAPLSGAVNGFMALGDQISKTSQRIGMSTGTLGGLKFAAEQCGANFETLTNGIKSFQNQLGAAQMGDDRAINKLSKVGLNADMFAGLDNEAQLMKVADYIKDIGDKAEQTRVSIALFGDAGFKLLPFFQEGSVGINKLITEGKDIGAVMGEDSVTAAVNLADAMNRLKTSAASVTNSLIGGLAPALSSLMDIMTFLIKYVTKFLNEWGGVAAAVAGYLIVGLNLKYHLLSISGILPKIASGIKLITAAMSSNPWLLGGAVAIGAIVAAWQWWNKSIKETEERLKAMNEEAIKHEQSVKAANAADQKLFDRLQELADMEDPLNNEEVREAQALIDTLEGKYGKLGITIDENTRKIHGMAQAQAILNKEMAQKELDALEERKKAVDAKISDLEAKRDAAYAKYNEEYELNEHYRQKHRYYKQAAYTNRSSMKRHKAEYEQYVAELGGLIDERSALAERQKALRGITNPEEATEPGKPQEQPKTLSQLKQESTAARSAQNAAKAELAGMKADTDLMDPLQKQYYELDQKYQKKVADLNRKIELAKKADQDTSSFNDEAYKIEQWRQSEIEKIGQGVIDERQKETDKEYNEWKEQNPELKAQFDSKKVKKAKEAVEAAKQAEAEAVLNDDLEGAQKAKEALDIANQNLAKEVAIVTQTKRKEATRNVIDAEAAYKRAQESGANNKTLNELYDKFEKALAEKEQADREYYEAVGTVRAGLKTPEEEVKEAVQVAVSSSGTFSAYGMDAAVQVNVTQEILVTLQKIYGVTDKMEKNQGNESVFTDKK